MKQMFKLLTLIQRGFCAEKLAQSKTLLVLRHRKVNKNWKYKNLTDKKKPKFINFCTFWSKLSKTHSPNYVHLQCTTWIQFFPLQILEWPVYLPKSRWFCLVYHYQNKTRDLFKTCWLNLICGPKVFWFFQQITLLSPALITNGHLMIYRNVQMS